MSALVSNRHEKALADAYALILQGDRAGEIRRDWCFEIVGSANQRILTVAFSEVPDPSASCGKVDPVFRINDALTKEGASDRSQKCKPTFGSDALEGQIRF
jgi:hypothetical protein